jgi:(2Fe-2S) ferredoxin
MKTIPPDYKKHVLVCTNDRVDGRSSCQKIGGQDLYLKLKEAVKQKRLSQDIWVTRTGCLGFCNTLGPTVTIYSKDKEVKWYNEITADDFETIFQEVFND